MRFLCCFGAATQRGSWPPRSWGFLDHIQRRSTVGRTPLDEWSARRRDLYLTTHDTHNRQISMPPVGLEPTISAGEWPQTYTLDRAAIGTGINYALALYNFYVQLYTFYIVYAKVVAELLLPCIFLDNLYRFDTLLFSRCKMPMCNVVLLP